MMTVVILSMTGCKKNVGTPEDNAVVEEDPNASEQKESKFYGYSCADLEDPFYQVLKEAIGTQLEQQGDRFIVRDAHNDPSLQMEQVQEMVEQGIEAMFFTASDPSDCTGAMELLEDADIPVILLETKLDNSELVESFVGTDTYNAGKLCGLNLRDRFPQGGNLILLEEPGNYAVSEGITGFEESIANGGFEVVKRINGSDLAFMNAELERVFSTGKKVDCIMSGNYRMTEQALDYLQSKGNHSVLVYGIGASPRIKSELCDPQSPMIGSGAQSPIIQGKIAVKTAEAILDGGSYEEECYVETFFINRENVEMYGTDGWQ